MRTLLLVLPLLLLPLGACSSASASASGSSYNGSRELDYLESTAPTKTSLALAAGERTVATEGPRPSGDPAPTPPGILRPLAAVKPLPGQPDFPLAVGDDELSVRRVLGPSAKEERISAGTQLFLAPFSSGCSLVAGVHRSDAHAPPCPVRRLLAVTVEGGRVTYLEWRAP